MKIIISMQFPYNELHGYEKQNRKRVHNDSAAKLEIESFWSWSR